MSRITAKDTVDFYRALLEDLGMVIDDNGFAYFDFGENDKVPATVDDKHLFLPTPERLKNIDVENTIAFHPLCQNVLRVDSQVFMALKKYITVQLTTRLHRAILGMSNLALDVGKHETLKPKQGEFLTHVTDYKKRTHTTLKQLLKQSNIDDHHKALLSLYVKKGGKVGDRQYSQACIVSFPLWDAIEESEGVQVFDSKFYSHKDKDAVMALLSYILPDKGKYSMGSTSSVAPNLDALLKSFYQLAKRLNVLFDRFESVIPDFEGAQMDLDWYDRCDVLKEMSLQIPALGGNDGEPHRHNSEEEEMMRRAASVHTHTSEPAPQTQQPPTRIGFNAPQPVEQMPESESESESHGVSWRTPEPVPAPQYPYGYPPQPPYGYPQQPNGYPPQPTAAPGYPPQNNGAPWGSAPNYNSGYVSRAERASGASSFQGNARETVAPWVTTSNTGNRHW